MRSIVSVREYAIRRIALPLPTYPNVIPKRSDGPHSLNPFGIAFEGPPATTVAVSPDQRVNGFWSAGAYVALEIVSSVQARDFHVSGRHQPGG